MPELSSQDTYTTKLAKGQFKEESYYHVSGIVHYSVSFQLLH